MPEVDIFGTSIGLACWGVIGWSGSPSGGEGRRLVDPHTLRSGTLMTIKLSIHIHDACLMVGVRGC